MTGIQSPPANFDQLSLLVEEVHPSVLVRLAWPDLETHCKFRTEIRFRFDAPDGSFGVLYAAFDLKTAFAETVLRDKPAAAGPGPTVPLDFQSIGPRRVIALGRGVEDRPLKLIKLYDEGLSPNLRPW